MSHNVTLSGISIEDMDILKEALAELNEEFGTRFELKEGAVASRNWGGFGYSGRSSGSRVLPNTVAVIHDPTMDYDITLTKGSDGTVSMQTEALMINKLIDKFGIDRKLSMDITTGDRCDLTRAHYGGDEALGMQAALGRIVQRYSVIATEREAALLGQSCRREVEQDTGVIHVVATVD